jgi:demethylmenaquinone methyltransferase/2-methoxy-6-polyprenyl-1,4-benzoquinol methylase
MAADEPMKAYYAARAPYYDDVYEKPERREDIAFLRARLPALFAGRNVLEVACGTGYWTRHIAPAAASMTATDAVPEPLELAKGRPGVHAVRFALADAYDLPESLGRFDAAFAGLWLSHVPVERRGEFLASLHRRLAPGAIVAFLDNSDVQLRDFPIVERDAAGNTFQLRRLKDGTLHRVLKNFPARDELEALVAPVGAAPEYLALQNFWLFTYRAAPAGGRV